MRHLIERARRILCDTPDGVCLDRARLVTAAYQENEAEPAPLRRALTLRHLLRHMTLDLETNPVFAGNVSSRPRAWMLLPEYGFHVPDQAIVEHPQLDGFLDGDAVPADLRAFWATRASGGGSAVGHLGVNLSRVVHEGLESIVAEIARHEGEGDAEQRVYRQAMAITCEAVIEWAGRYARAAAEAAGEAQDPVERRALERVAAACERVPARPARDLFEALQAMVLVHLALHLEGHGFSVSIGSPDRTLEPFLAEAGAPETVDILAAFLLKLSANSVWGSFSKTQAITIGGADETGADRSNAFTLAFLEASAVANMPDPHVFLRWHGGLDRRVRQRAVELLAEGRSMPLLVGDEQTAGGFIRAGIPPADAWQYAIFGCNELGIPGKMVESAIGPGMNHLEVLNRTLLAIEDPDAVASVEEILARHRDAVRRHLRQAVQGHRRHRTATAERAPMPLTTALMDGGVARARDFHVAMEYNLPGMYERGLTNAANALASIQQVVFDQRSLRLSEVLAAMRSDFPDEAVQGRLLDAPRWGNDDERADRWALRLQQIREDVKREVEAEQGEPYHLSCHVVRSLHHVDGKRIGASADGRRAGMPVADSIGAHVGTAKAGPTAVLNSVRKLEPATYWAGGTNLNLNIPPAAAADVAQRASLVALVDAFFAGGGQELQLCCLDAAALRRAQRYPEEYPDLLVRVAGFNARFVCLSPAEQEEVIARAEAARG